MKNPNQINFVLFLSLLTLTFLFSACKKEDFNYDLIPGEYIGSLFYIESSSGGAWGNTNQKRSNPNDFRTTVRMNGSNYVLSFDKYLPYTIPDITVRISSHYNDETVAIKTIEGQAYSTVIKQNTYMNQPNSYFSISKYPQAVYCDLELISNESDSTHILFIKLSRTY